MKINRLTEIVLLLLNRKSITAKELANKFDVSVRTIYRDIDTLSTSGVPIYMNKGKGGGIALIEEYSLNKTILSSQDKENLSIALKTLGSLDYPNTEELIDKLGFIIPKESMEDFIEIDLSRWGSKKSENDIFLKIKDALLNKNLIEITYLSSFTQETKRELEPMKLIYKGQTWYLYAYCRLKNDIRLFRISRIKEITIKEENFIRREVSHTLDINEGVNSSSFKILSLKLNVSKDILYRMYDDVNRGSIIEKEDGSYEVSVDFPENDWIYGYLLSFGNQVEVLEPKYVRDEVINRMKESLKIYENDR